MADITVVVPTRNEELAIARCVQAALQLGPVYVVDSHSTDETAAIATRAGAVVVNYSWDGRYPKKKQWVLDSPDIPGEWIFFVDADEVITSDLCREVRQLDLTSVGAVDVGLLYRWNGRALNHGYRVVKRALVHRKRAQFPVVDDLDVVGMGEQEGHYQPASRHEVIQLQSLLTHDDPDGLTQWMNRHNRYSDWEAQLQSLDRSKSIDSFKSAGGRLFAHFPLKSLSFFCYSYFARAGFLDGRAGFDYAVANAVYYWMIAVKRRELGSN